MKRSILALTFLVSAIGFASQASAAEGYACAVVYHPPTAQATSGNFGRVTVEVWSGAYCSGSYVKQVTAYSTGAYTVDADPKYLYREQPLMVLYRNLVDSALRGTKLNYFTGANGLGLTYVQFTGKYY